MHSKGIHGLHTHRKFGLVMCTTLWENWIWIGRHCQKNCWVSKYFFLESLFVVDPASFYRKIWCFSTYNSYRFLWNVIFIIIARHLPILLAIKLCSSISMMAAEFDNQNTKTKKKHARPDFTQIIIAKKSLSNIFIVFSTYTQINRLCNSSETEHSNFCR